jgi:hypothetical protein
MNWRREVGVLLLHHLGADHPLAAFPRECGVQMVDGPAALLDRLDVEAVDSAAPEGARLPHRQAAGAQQPEHQDRQRPEDLAALRADRLPRGRVLVAPTLLFELFLFRAQC